MKQLAQALLDEYPNQEVVIFFNPYFVDGLIQIGAFTDADTLANAIFEMKQDLAITEVLDINWFDFSKQLGKRFDSAEELQETVSESPNCLEALMVDEWSLGEITVKPIDRVPDDVSFVL